MNLPLTVIIVCLVLVGRVSTDPTIVYKLKNIECIANPKRVENISCFIKAINWNKAVAQMDCDLILPLRNTSIEIAVLKKNYNNQYHPFLINVTFNACDMLSSRKYLPYAPIVRKVMKIYTNVNHTCPITNHLIARNLNIDETFLPTFPLGFYAFSIKITENFSERPSDSIGLIKIYLQAIEMVNIKQRKKPNNSTIIMPSI
ncbi:uncharacterized protein [Drosophila virilis]|uniref:uncharacterized protein n=1 Tax=Drosophila virilis TaxID=7244 RepID=UPI0038B403C3